MHISLQEEDEKDKKPKTIDAKEAQKVKERKKKELEDVSLKTYFESIRFQI